MMFHYVAWCCMDPCVRRAHIKTQIHYHHYHKHWPGGWFLATKHPWSTPWNSTCNPWYKCQGSIGQPTSTNVHDLFLLLSARFQTVITLSLSLGMQQKNAKGQNRWLSSSCKFSRIQHFAKTGACIKKIIPQSGNQPWETPPFGSMIFPMSMPIYRDFPASHVWLVAALWAAGTVQGPRSWLSRLPRWPGR